MNNDLFIITNENHLDNKSPRTVICTGLGRSGTSAVISLVDYLGIWIGDVGETRSREYKVLAGLLGEDMDKAAEVIDHNNMQHDVWAFKSPGFRDRVADTISLFRNPLLIIPHRDIVGIATRKRIEHGMDLSSKELLLQLRMQRKTIERIGDLPIPQLHISFELLVHNPEMALRAIANFVGMPVPEGDVHAFMKMHRDRYLRKT